MSAWVWLVLSWLALALAALPTVMILRNLSLYRPARLAQEGVGPVSVLIPARDEAAGIETAVRSVLAAGEGLTLEVVVLDDHSTDGTAEVVRRIAAQEARVRLEQAPELPAGWLGKCHACWVLAQRAKHDTLVWIDADVTLAPASLARMCAELKAGNRQLLSGVPLQLTGSWLEVLIVPQVLLVLLGYLPMGRMRADNSASLGVGCGQLFVVEKQAYFACGGHAAIKSSRHEGVHLPRVFRTAGFRTDLFDATDVATCRMYHNAAQTWQGFLKNATAGMGSPRSIGVWTTLLLGGHVLPWVLLAAGGWRSWVVVTACALSAGSSVLIARRFRQGLVAAMARPMGVAVLVLLQWVALVRECLGYRPTWRGRVLER